MLGAGAVKNDRPDYSCESASRGTYYQGGTFKRNFDESSVEPTHAT